MHRSRTSGAQRRVEAGPASDRRFSERAVRAVSVLALVAMVSAGSALAQTDPVTILSPVYSDGQAARGASVYRDYCAFCHGAELEGGEQGPVLVGSEFLGFWEGLSLGDLYNVVSTSMPQDNPGALDPQQYTDVLAFLLQASTLPSGQAELPADTEALGGIQIVMPAEAPESSGPAGDDVAEASFEVDPYWPQPLPDGWLLGNVVGVAVDSQDNVWIIHRPNSQQGAEGTPPVIAFDREGAVVQAWGGPGEGYDWGTQTHGIGVDPADNVWVGFGGGLPYDPASRATTDNALVLKFTPEGEFLLQIGDFGRGTEGSASPTFLGQPTDIHVDTEDDEVYISDGYTNRRVIVFDATTGEPQRLWGGYGEAPDDDAPAGDGTAPPRQFSTPHCVIGGSDGLIYVCDRGNQRIQVFEKNGTFVREATLEADGEAITPWDIAFTPDDAQLVVADGGGHRVYVVDRDSLEVVGVYGRRGRWAGQFESPHSLAIDSGGNLFVGETLDGRRVQKFVPAH